MYRILNSDYTFISTAEVEAWRKEQGWKFGEEYSYELKTAAHEEDISTALLLAKYSDVMIIGSAPEFYVRKRMEAHSDKITYRYQERIFKRGTWRFLSPRGFLGHINTYYRYPHKNLYMLCASAYTSGDLMLHGCYRGKCYKWGYFPETRYYNLEQLMEKKNNEKIILLWCGRLINWKHPEAALTLAQLLKSAGMDFSLLMIGSGEERTRLEEIIREYELASYVELIGSMTPESVRNCMEQANIFLFTSDYQEGWGAVVNEAMNSGCAVVASHAAGSVPYLIKDGINGMIYKNGDITQLYQKVRQLIMDRQLCEKLGRNAYDTIVQEWNAGTAAERLLCLSEDLQNYGSSSRYQSGPCSRAQVIHNYWFSGS